MRACRRLSVRQAQILRPIAMGRCRRTQADAGWDPARNLVSSKRNRWLEDSQRKRNRMDSEEARWQTGGFFAVVHTSGMRLSVGYGARAVFVSLPRVVVFERRRCDRRTGAAPARSL